MGEASAAEMHGVTIHVVSSVLGTLFSAELVQGLFTRFPDILGSN